MAEPKIERLAVLYMNQGTENQERITVTRITWDDSTEYVVTARADRHPDNYQQQWVYKDCDNPGQCAMNKALSYMGWGTAESHS